MKQTSAANLYANVRNSAANSYSLLKAEVKMISTGGNVKIVDRQTMDTNSTIGAANSTTYSTGTPVNVITLSKFSFVIVGGTAATNIKIEVAPTTAAAHWTNDDTVVRTLAANTVTILQPTRFSKYVRLSAKQSGTASATLAVYYQGHV